MPKYEVDALRVIRSMQQSHEIAGHGPMAERMRAVGDQVERMAKELADAKAKNAVAVRTMMFILNECDWEDFTGDCGDNRIGSAIRETLVRMRISHE